ncbi:transmembrane 7 superfamily member 3 [Patella vulgata]|uniref:transmembrane 7 superfamily member 3 n=1 Tax=Patella vulgata TaxID=6465 RepID=UPI00217FA5C5|nr:transmembrane 7 superfamily member 3 [Patella vulgata]
MDMKCLLLFSCCFLAVTKGDVDLTEGKVTSVKLTNGTSRLVHNVDKTGISFIIIEVHSQTNNLTLSWKNTFTQDSTARGRNVGVMTPYSSPGNIYWFIKTDEVDSVNVLLLVKYLKINDPIPGGCNQILNLENDPNMLLSYTDYWTSVRFQWANIDTVSECESSLMQKQLEYDVYVYFVKEAKLDEKYFLDAMKKMIGVENIIANGRKVMSLTNDMKTKSNFTLSSINGQGGIYGVVVKNTRLNTVASYVSVASYGCNLTNQTCEIDVEDAEYVIGALCFLVGVGLCFFGHKFLKTEFFVFGFLAWTIISFVLLTLYTGIDPVLVLTMSCIIGIAGGGICVLFWWYWGIPILSVLIVGFVGGFLFSAVLFFTPFGNLDVWNTELNYWMAFTCALLIYPLVLLCFTKTLNILTCAFVGSYLICIIIDYLLHTTLKLIILNTINHAIIDGYEKIKVVTPFDINDIIMVVTWAVLCIVGTAIQFNLTKGHAPFPPCPRAQRRRRLEQARNRQRAMDQFDNERQPLICERPRQYNTYQRQELYQPS